ncbi:MAG: glycosyltransferase family 4 protein [Alphaproteobacteria bacterium]|nr:glycosyltransferase family 4 protein [Alphaproteobacteria bacterium]
MYPMHDKKPPVILQVLPALSSGGVERGTVEIARAIQQAGGRALVASSGGKMMYQLFRLGAEHITLPLDSKNPFTVWRNARALVGIIREHGVDIVHARSRAPAWCAWLAAYKTGCRFVTTFHGTYGIQNRFKHRYNSVMVKGERVIAISNFIAEHIKANYAVDPANIRIIHRGVDLNLFTPDLFSHQRMDALIKEWRLPMELPVILFPGRITRWKGQDVFLRALAALPHRHFFAVILGDDKKGGSYRGELESLITELGLEEHVRFAEHTQHITEAYMLARVVVATSIEPEAFGRVVLEAQAMGKPVIATSHGGPQETVIHGETGLLVPPGDVGALAAAIENVMGLDETMQQHIARDARKQAERFSLDTMCEKTLAVYEELL